MRIDKVLFLISVLMPATLFAQQTYRGIVVDSSSVSALPGVHVTVKHSTKGVTTSASGSFIIQAMPTDTLVFTSVGYTSLELPLLFEETALFIRLRETIRLLSEITIKASRLDPNIIVRSPRTAPRPMTAGEGIFSPIDYFSRWQREKRKLLKWIEESDRTLTYLQVVSDQEIREQLMEEFELDETVYYDLLAQFNQRSAKSLQYSTNPQEIITSLKSFLSSYAK
jgi:hypothetical protein